MSYINTIRCLLVTLAAACITASGLSAAPNALAPGAQRDPWLGRDEILARIKAPEFPKRDFVITDHGALAGGETDARPAIVAAFEACVKAGGGRVVIPSGVFLCNGPIHLRSGVNLHVSGGATLLFGTNPKDYMPVVLTRWEGTMLYNYSPLIYAYKQTNIAITGKGTINGNGKEGMYNFVKLRRPDGKGSMHERDRQALWRMGAAQTPVTERVFGDGHYLRPGGIEPVECEGVLIEGVTVTNMPFWCVHPVYCTNLTVRGIRIESTTGNNDGVDPDSCRDVLIEDCYFKTGDDSIAIKSGRDQDGWRVARPCENIVIRRCIAAGKLYGFAIGSEMSGGVRNVFIEDCKVLDGKRAAIYTKSNPDRGGTVENVYVRRIEVGHVNEAAVRFETNYHGWRGENHPPQFRNFVVEDVTCTKSNNYGVYFDGQPGTPVRDVVLRRITVGEAKKPLWIHHIDNVRFEDVRINGELMPASPPLTPADERKLSIRD
ncbi:glycoside hydrolase family 28 protein [Ereboglobus luteus]|uniref:Glycoside hydrolase n=1 Tax=Ereboglobus luteus TaxID=1796921 RepID=A0A2U8E5Y4_9BACT|nr:glycoside hydrolase family 28 protein [Ereboglobus luteus]AWI10273.1 hypothetical protein CKA38_14340 [Ereboglobus luteus]